MKRYLVFAGDDYYPSGGWLDFVSDHDTIDEATAAAKPLVDDYKWAHVVDTHTPPRPADGYVHFDGAGGSVEIRGPLDKRSDEA